MARQSRSFSEQFGNLKYLLQHSVTIIGKNKAIAYPMVAMAVYSFLLTSFFFLAIAFILADIPVLGFLLLLPVIFFWFLRFIFYVYQKMAMSWLVHQTILGLKRSFGDSQKHAMGLKGQILGIAVVDVVMKYAGSKSKQAGGIVGIVIRLVVAGLAKVWDLARHFLLPSIAIDRHTLKQSVEEMKKLKERVPETLVGVFGIDFVGNIVMKLISPIYFVIILLGLAIGWALGGFLPDIMVLPLDDGLSIAWPPVLAMIFLAKSISILLAYATASVKVIYFTIFYTQLVHGESINPALRDDLKQYLRLEEGVELEKSAGW